MSTRQSALRVSLAVVTAAVLLAACGKSPDKLVKSGEEYLAKGDVKAAVIQFKNALVEQPDNGRARLLLGQSLLATGDLPGAEKELRRALELGQPADQVLPLLTRALLEQGQTDAVIKEFAQRKLDAPAAEAEFKAYLGDAMLAGRQRSQAEAAYAQALAAQPGHPRARLGQARIMAIDGKLGDATVVVEQVVASDATLGEAGLLLAELRAAQGDNPGARKALEAAIAAKPDFKAARVALIQGLIATNDLDEAGRQIEAAHAAKVADLQLSYLEAVHAWRKGDKAKASELLAQVLKVAPQFPPALVLAGLLELGDNKFGLAETHFQAALAQAPGHTGARRLLASTYLRSGQAGKARDTLQPLMEGKTTPDAGLLLLAGEAALASGDPGRAAGYFKVAAEGGDAAGAGRRAAAHTRLGQLQLQGGNAELGLRELEAASAIDPNLVQADLTVIANHLARKEYDKALEAARKLEKKQPDKPLSHVVLGNVHLARKDMAAARKSFEQALKIDPAYLQAAFALGNLDLADKKPEAARERYEAILAKDPKKEGAYLGLADLTARAGGKPEDVVKALQRGISAAPGSTALRLALASYYLAQRDARQAVQTARDAAAQSPDDPRVLEVLANAQEAAGETNQAIDTLNKLVQVAPRQELALVRLAAAHARMDQFDKAAEVLRRVANLRPDDEGVSRELVAVLMRAKRPEEALKEARTAQTAHAKSGIGYLLEGEIFETQGKPAEAEAVYRKGLAAQPKSPLLVVRLHALLARANRSAEADALVAKWLKAEPKDVAVRLYLAEREMAGRQFKSAAAQYKAVLAVQPDNVLALNNLAWVSGELGDPQALAYAERAARLAPQNANVLDTFASLLVRKGELDKGLELHQRAVQMAPDAANLHVNYAQALIKAGKKDLARKQLEAAAATPGESPAKKQAAELLKSL